MELSTNEKSRLKSKYGDWAIVTGASSGIGLELTKQLASAGLNLVINGKQLDKLQAVEKELKSHHPIEIKIINGDVSEEVVIERILNTTTGLNVGLLITSAGYGTSGLFLDIPLAAERNMLRVNCEAVLTLTHHYSRQFRQQKRGGIIFLSSLVAFQGVPFSANYAASKAYKQSLAEALAIELKPFGIDVLAAAPGPVDSGFGQRANMNMGKAMKPSELSVPILKALGKQTNVIPGTLSKILVYSLRTVPRWAKVRIMQKVMDGFTQHQRK